MQQAAVAREQQSYLEKQIARRIAMNILIRPKKPCYIYGRESDNPFVPREPRINPAPAPTQIAANMRIAKERIKARGYVDANLHAASLKNKTDKKQKANHEPTDSSEHESADLGEPTDSSEHEPTDFGDALEKVVIDRAKKVKEFEKVLSLASIEVLNGIGQKARIRHIQMAMMAWNYTFSGDLPYDTKTEVELFLEVLRRHDIPLPDAGDKNLKNRIMYDPCLNSFYYMDNEDFKDFKGKVFCEIIKGIFFYYSFKKPIS
jgi:hypothetical protein